MTLSAGATLGPYEVVELLGAGGMGEVYRAHDPRLGREVAVKVLPPEVAAEPGRLQRFEREAKAVASLNHPHILTVYDVGTDDGSPYVATELLEGETLREVLTRRTPTRKQVLGFAVQTAQGLAAAHRKGLVHRDLRPENLFVTNEGPLKILDFGLAKLTAPATTGDTTGTTDAAPTRPGALMGTVAYMSPEQVQALPVDARSDIFSLGVVLHELLSTRHPFRRETVAATLTAILHDTPPDLDSQPAGLPPAMAGIVARCLEKRPEDRFQTSHDLALALEAVLQAPTGSATLQELEERSPYPGLRSFTEKDAGVFFGREGEVQELWGRIRSRKLLAVIGPSGVGKTSFIRAGVLATRPAGWGAIVATPGAQPFRSLGRALGPELAGDSEALARIVDFEDPENAFDLVGRWRRGQEEALLVLDQFEELFTLNPPEVQERFAGVLGRLAKEGDIHVVLSLRDDFLIRCCEQEALAPVLRELTALLSLKSDDLRRALVEPAKKQGYRFEDEPLVEEMVESVDGARAALPLLAFAVSRLWERRDREKKLLRRESYEAIGGVAGALAQHAEQTLDRIGSERQPLVREMFRNLVTAQGTRAVADREELLSVFADERESADEVLWALVDSRLLTSYEVQDEAGDTAGPPEANTRAEATKPASSHRIEIAHESLLKAWPRLVRWQAQDEEGAVLRDQLRQAAHLWKEKGRSPDVLWSGTALREFELWQERYPGKLTALEEDFAHSMVERGRRRRTLRQVIAGSVVAAALAVACVTGVLWWRSEMARERAEASKLLALAQARLEEDPTEALALTTASIELADTREARLFATRALWVAPPARELDQGRKDLNVPAFSPDGRWIAVAGHSEKVGVWSDDGNGPILLSGHEFGFDSANRASWFSGDLLVTGVGGSFAEWVHIWALPTGRRLRTIDFGAPTYWLAGPEHLLTETLEDPRDLEPSRRRCLLRSWSLPDGDETLLGRVSLPARPFSSTLEPYGRAWLYTKGRTVYFRSVPVVADAGDRIISRHDDDVGFLQRRVPRERRFLARAKSGEIGIWSFPPEGPVEQTVIPKPETAPDLVYPDPTGRWVTNANPSEDRCVRLWRVGAIPGARPLSLRRRGSWYLATQDIHPEGDWVTAPTSDGVRLTFWPLRRSYPSVVDGYAGLRLPLAFSPDGKWLATSWPNQRELRLWPLERTQESTLRRIEMPEANLWCDLRFDPKGQYLFVVGLADRAYIVPLDGSPARKLDSFSDSTLLEGAAVSPSGRQVATAYRLGDGRRTLRVWDVENSKLRQFELPEMAWTLPESPEELAGFAGNEVGITRLRFADETTLYTAGAGGFRRWDLATGTNTLLVETGAAGGPRSVLRPKAGIAISLQSPGGDVEACHPAELYDLGTGKSRVLEAFGDCVQVIEASASGSVIVTGDLDGAVRVGRISGGEPHVLLGHKGNIMRVEISADMRWIASAGEDSTLRLWPMPELDKPPLHTLPRDDLIAKLRSLTNIRAVRDPEAPEGWSIQLDPFPGWKDVPTW